MRSSNASRRAARRARLGEFVQVIFTPSPPGTSIACMISRRTRARVAPTTTLLASWRSARILRTFPRRGTQRDDLLPGLRVTGFERRVTVAFVVTDAAVLIEGIFYGGQDFEALFRNRE